MGKGAAMATVTHEDIYTEVRSYLIGLFSCPVVRGYQNNSPLPADGIVMTVISERDFDYASNYYTESDDEDIYSVDIQKSVEVVMQLDFYGVESQKRVRHVANVWQSEFSTNKLVKCQPLYSKQPMQMQYINEKNQYEQRWMLEVLLQYNPCFTHDQQYLDVPTFQIRRT